MPFKSEKQRKYLFANEPKIAKQWAKNYKHLLYIACSASFGIKAGKGAMGLIKKK